VSLTVNKVLGSDYDTSALSNGSMAAPAFKKVKKSKKRLAEDDILSVLEKIADEEDSAVYGLGTRESKT